MKIVAISDTHTKHAKVTIPECDVLIHAGDSTWTGKFGEVVDFVSWLREHPAKRIIVIAGTHELTLDRYHRKFDPSIRDLVARDPFDRITYLENQSVTIDGVKFYGTPYTPWFHDWAFNGVETGTQPFSSMAIPKLRDIYNYADEDTDVLVCHGPAFGCADVKPGENGNDDERLGSTDLLRRTQQLKKLKLLICGHIHEARGFVELQGKLYANVATLDRDYETARPPVVFEVNENTAQILSGY